MSARQKAAVHAAHLSRKLQHSVTAMRSGEGLPPDLLTPAAVDTRFIGAAGFPDLADSVAYDPSQGLLAVGTSDGRVVLLGQPGVEATLRSPSRSPTQHLCFLPGKGGLLRVTKDGDIQLFSATARRLLTSTWLQGDAIRSVALLGAGPQAGAGAADAPYVLLGCESGNVRVVALLDGQGQPAAGARPVADLALQPYQVLGEEVDAKGSVAAVAVAHLRPDRPLLLLVHRNSGTLVWDVRAERILCMALEYEGEASKPTCACWVGERANCFAVGYDDGSVLLWGVPSQALQDDPFKVVEPPDARPLMTLRVAARGVQAAPIRSLHFLAGSSSGGSGGSGGGQGWNGEDSLLVFGGQSAEDPDMLTLVPLPAAGQGTELEGAGRQVPWFGAVKGFCLMPAEGAAEGRSLMILTEGGQLVIHDLLHWQPQPLTLPAQELPPITVSKLVPTVNAEQQGEPGGSAAVSPRSPSAASVGLPSPSPLDPGPLSAQSCPAGPAASLPQHALTLDRVRACSRRLASVPSGGAGQEPSVLEHWPFSGGQPAASLAGSGGGRRHPSALFFSGHRDGRVRVWDATTQVPEMLLTIPAAAGQERLRAVTALEVCPFSGIVAVGHAGGDVRLYQFTESPQQVHRMNIDETRIPYENVGTQPGGFQYVLRYSCHPADVSALALATKLKLVAVADESGTVSLLDLLQPSQLFTTRAMEQPVAGLAFGSHVIPGVKEEPDVERVVLFLAGADSSACIIGLDRGEPIGRAMKPKNASRPLVMALLDAAGCPLPLLHGGLVLHWANNNSAATVRSLAMTKVASIREEPGQASSRSLGRLSMSDHPSSLPAPPGGSRRSNGADSRASWSRAESGTDADTEREGSVEMHALPSDDEIDDHLAAAVQAVEDAQRGKSGKFKLPTAFKRPGSRSAAAGGEAGASSPGGSAHGGASFDPVAALGEFYGGSGPPSPDAWERSGGGGGDVQPQGGMGQPADGGLLSDADLIDYPFLIDGDPTPAAYLLLCCADYLRLYPTANIRLGDRSTERKASFEAPLCFASPFMSVHGPGVVSVDASDALQVHSLPGLETLCRKQLEDSRVLGFRWTAHPLASQGSGPGSSGIAAGSMCCSLDGQVVLASAANEIVRLAVVADCALPAPPASLYNTRLAAAALEAAARRPGVGAVGYPARLDSQAAQQPAAAGQQQEGEAGPANAFGRFFDQAASTMTGLATTAAGTVMQELDRARAVGQGALQRIGIESGGPSRSLPTLEALFATPVEPLDDLDYMPEDEEGTPVSPAAAAAATAAPGLAGPAESTAAAAGAAGPSGRAGLSRVTPREAAAKLKNLLPVVRSKSDRAELLDREGTPSSPAAAAAASARSGAGAGAAGGGAAAATRGKVFTRTASEIKRAYGRPGASKSSDVRGVMEQNRAMLAERGERLAALDERTREMADDAEDFATMAKRLEQQMANRKWWQL